MVERINEIFLLVLEKPLLLRRPYSLIKYLSNASREISYQRAVILYPLYIKIMILKFNKVACELPQTSLRNTVQFKHHSSLIRDKVFS